MVSGVSGVDANSFNASKAALDDAMRAEQLQAKEDHLQSAKDLNDSKRDTYKKSSIQARQ